MQKKIKILGVCIAVLAILGCFMVSKYSLLMATKLNYASRPDEVKQYLNTTPIFKEVGTKTKEGQTAEEIYALNVKFKTYWGKDFTPSGPESDFGRIMKFDSDKFIWVENIESSSMSDALTKKNIKELNMTFSSDFDFERQVLSTTLKDLSWSANKAEIVRAAILLNQKELVKPLTNGSIYIYEKNNMKFIQNGEVGKTPIITIDAYNEGQPFTNIKFMWEGTTQEDIDLLLSTIQPK